MPLHPEPCLWPQEGCKCSGPGGLHVQPPEFEIVHTEPVLSERDAAAVEQYKAHIITIQQDYMRAAEPWQKLIADIYARYPRPIIILGAGKHGRDLPRD